MKKTLLLMLVALLSLTATAQNSHLSFQGIPLDGTITQFESKLKAKGWMYSKELSSVLDENARAYLGVFAGHKGMLIMRFAPTSKTVYSANFCANKVPSRSQAENTCLSFVQNVRRAYPNAKQTTDDTSTRFTMTKGLVVCGVMEYSSDKYSASIIYTDQINQDLCDNENDAEFGTEDDADSDSQMDPMSISETHRVPPAQEVKTFTVDENKIFDVVEQMPMFPGGQDALMRFLSTYVKYPTIAQENGIQGIVIVGVVVEKDGSLGNVHVLKGVDPSLDREAVRVVSAMPKWIPGKQNGTVARVKFNVPVTFRLQ